MNTQQQTPLDSFEAALLAELRDHIATRVPERRPHRVRRWAAGITAAAAVATGVVVTGLGGGAGPSPAFAVEKAGGDVVVTIHRLEDSEALEEALAREGIDAEVDYDAQVDPGLLTVPGVPVDQAEPGGSGEYELDIVDGEGVCGSDSPATLTDEGDAWVLRIPVESPIQDRPVSILTTREGGLGVSYEAVPGTVCALLAVEG